MRRMSIGLLLGLSLAGPARAADLTAFMELANGSFTFAVSSTQTSFPITEPAGATSVRITNTMPCDVKIGSPTTMATSLARTVEVMSFTHAPAIYMVTIPTTSVPGVTTPACTGNVELAFGTGL